MNGWFAVNRAMFDHPIFAGHADRVGIWVWMIATAAWKDTKQDANGTTITVKRGQLLTSYRQMSQATGAGIKTCRNLILRLQTGNAIDTDTGTGRLLVTIRNYEKYQASSDDAGTGRGTRRAHDGHTKEQGNKVITEDTNVSSGNAQQKKAPQKASMPEGWAPDEDGVAYARSLKLTDAEIEEIGNDFQAYWADRTDAKGKKSERGWRQAWRNWVRNDAPKTIRCRNVVSPSFAQGRGQGGGIAGAVARRQFGDPV